MNSYYIELAILVVTITASLIYFVSSIYSSKTREQMRHYAVIICGPDPHNDQHSKNERGQHYISLLSNADQTHIHWSQFVVYKNQFPTASEIASFDALVLSGSKFNAHDEQSLWMRKLREIIRHVYNNQPNTKLLGICFGHQIIANSLNFGKSGPNPTGVRDSCVRDIRLHNQFFKTFSSALIPKEYEMLREKKSIRVAKSHGDVVLLLPENAVLLASSEVANVEMYAIDNRVLGVQGHPEWTAEYFCACCNNNEHGIPAKYDLWRSILQKWLHQ